MADTRPIGVFDSGVGGLTAVKELHRLLPQEDIIYFGDTGRVPYGSRSKETIQRYAAEIIQYLAKQNVKAILAACGTVSSNFNIAAYQKLGLTVPYLVVTLPAIHGAVVATKNQKIGVLATNASVRSGVYTQGIKTLLPQAQVTEQGCPLLVALVENGLIDLENQITNLTLQMYLAPLQQAGVDTVILGCTHFPLLAAQIQKIMGDTVTLVDSGASAVGELQKQIVKNSSNHRGNTRYFVTDTVEHFTDTAQVFLKEDISSSTIYVNPETIDGSSNGIF